MGLVEKIQLVFVEQASVLILLLSWRTKEIIPGGREGGRSGLNFVLREAVPL